jgi:hypothetical protein
MTERHTTSQVVWTFGLQIHRLVAGGVDMAARNFTAVLHQDEDLYVAECPEVGTVS